MSKGKGKVRSTAKTVERAALSKLLPFFAPHFLGPFITVSGIIAHNAWGIHLPAAAIMPIVTLSIVAGLSFLTWRYAIPRNVVIRWHAVATVASAGLCFFLLQVFGGSVNPLALSFSPFSVALKWPSALAQLSLVVGFISAVSWNIRRLEVIRGEGEEQKQEEPADWHGIKKPRSSRVIDQDGNVTRLRARLDGGQISDDVARVVRRMGSDVGAIPNGVRVIPSDEVEGEVEIAFFWRDLLRNTVEWYGPDSIGMSCAMPVSIGVNEEQVIVMLSLVGNYDKHIAPSHLKIGGMPRSGKGILVILLLLNYMGRIDCMICLSDHSKGEQMIGLVRPGIVREKFWVEQDEAGCLNMAKAIVRSIRDRNMKLGQHGYSSWTPKAAQDPNLRMPAIFFFVEEAASLISKAPQTYTRIANEGLSAGVFMIVSLQRLSHSQVPTDLRAALASGICFGTDDDMDASFVLDESTMSTGVDPGQWKTRHPGRFMCSVNGVDDRVNLTPGRTFFGMTQEDFENYAREVSGALRHAGMAPDPVTRASLGPAFEAYVSGQPVVPETASRPAGPVSFDPTTVVTDDESESEDDEMDYDEENEDFEMDVEPADHPEDEDAMNPRKPLAAPSVEVDMTPAATPGRITRQLTPLEKEHVFRDVLSRFAGKEVTTGVVIEEWRKEFGYPEANQSPTVGRLLNRACDEWGLADRGKRGHYFVHPVRVNAHA